MSDHGHDHADVPAGGRHRTRLAIALGITGTIFMAQLVGAIWTGSLALLVDTAHVLTDAAGLLMALIAAVLVDRPATNRHTWGLRRAEVLAASIQAVALLGVGAFVVIEGIQRLFHPPEINAPGLLAFGIVGLVGNVASIAVLASSRSDNLNLRGAFLEVLNDALGSLAVIVSALVIATTGWAQVDTLTALLIGALILPRALRLLRDAVEVLLESTPRDLDLDAVRAHILELDHVRAVHDLHASQIATGLPVLTAHVVIDDECFHDGHAPVLLTELQACVAEHFPVSVEHSTFQLEPATHTEAARHD